MLRRVAGCYRVLAPIIRGRAFEVLGGSRQTTREGESQRQRSRERDAVALYVPLRSFATIGRLDVYHGCERRVFAGRRSRRRRCSEDGRGDSFGVNAAMQWRCRCRQCFACHCECKNHESTDYKTRHLFTEGERGRWAVDDMPLRIIMRLRVCVWMDELCASVLL